MLNLSSTSDKVQVVTTTAANLDVLSSFVDLTTSTGAIAADRQAATISSATTTDIVAVPSSGVVRNVQTIMIRNRHASTANTVTVQQVTGSGTFEIIKVSIGAGQTLTFLDGAGWQLIDTNGAPVASVAFPQTRAVLTAGSAATYTTPARCRAIEVECVGGGGAGGGGATAASSGAMGGGGGSGGFTKKLIASPAATYTYTIGAGGTAGSAGNNVGNNGADTTFSTLTAKGGTGGGGMAAAATAAYSAGGAAGIAGSGGDINQPGQPGSPGMRATAALGASGNGAPSLLGPGAIGIFNAQATGTSATANTGGGGAGGSTVSAGAATAGGAGGSGLIIVTEHY